MRRVADAKLLVHLLLLIGAVSLPCLQLKEDNGRKRDLGEGLCKEAEKALPPTDCC